ncbi:MAG TPA: flagellar hook-length control protein FliK, partial [Ruminiclostridium sp.]|nr:flagellar hook-length control protein FliK [Ruminiclostridium sp.]
MLMNNNSLFKISFAKDNSQNVINIKTKPSQSTSGSSFKSVLDKTVNNYNHRADDVQKNDYNQDSSDKTKFKSFAEVQMNAKTTSNKAVGPSDTTKQVSEANNEKPDNGPEKYDEQIVALAQMLGISPGQLVDFAKQLGYTPEDLKDVKKLAAFMQKASDLLKLNDKQKDVLLKLATEVSNQTKADGAADISKTSESNISDIGKSSTPQTGKATVDLSELAVTIKEKLDAMIDSGKNTPELISDEVAKIISAMKAQSQSKVNVETQQADTEEVKALPLDSKNNIVKDSKIKEDSKQKETAAQSSETEKTAFNLKSVSTAAQTAPSTDQNLQQDQQNLQALGDIKAVLNNSQVPAEKSDFALRQPVKT